MRTEDDNTMMMNNTCVAFGSFEFVHRGHRKIAEKVVEVAKEKGLTPVIVCQEKEGKVFTTEEEKEYLLKSLGIEMVLSFHMIEIEELISILVAKVIVIGETNPLVEQVKELAEVKNVEVVVVPTVYHEGIVVTTQTVKNAYEASDYKYMMELCGHPYIMIGQVVHGKKLGRTENMPTANIEVAPEKIKPKHAVYGAKVRLGEEILDAVVNIGRRPTVDDFDYTTIEALLLDFNRQIYGEKLVLEIHSFIREIQKFDNLAEVREQIDKDIKKLNFHISETF